MPLPLRFAIVIPAVMILAAQTASAGTLGGAPAVQPPGAIVYVDANWTGLEKMRAWAARTDSGAQATG